jgi:aerobic carbon-monoxide dehydrogenase medium subunit
MTETGSIDDGREMSDATRLKRARTVDEALGLLAGDEEARPLAGGASLVAMMNAALISPSLLVSLRDIAELGGIAPQADGSIRIGAMTRHRETAAEARLSGTLAVVRAAAGNIANPPVRNMGTMGGSIALADPGADYPPALVAAGATVEIASPAGRRRVAARDFFVDWYTTALEPGDLVTAILLPRPGGGVGLYHKLMRVAGDFATVSVALSAARDGTVSLAIGGCGPAPVAAAEADHALAHRLGDAAAARRAGDILAELANPVDDVRATADYRRLIIPRMVERAAAEAAAMLEEKVA